MIAKQSQVAGHARSHLRGDHVCAAACRAARYPHVIAVQIVIPGPAYPCPPIADITFPAAYSPGIAPPSTCSTRPSTSTFGPPFAAPIGDSLQVRERIIAIIDEPERFHARISGHPEDP